MPMSLHSSKQSVQTLWVSGSGLLVENSSPDPLPTITLSSNLDNLNQSDLEIGITHSLLAYPKHGEPIMMNMLFTLLDLSATALGNEHHYTKI